MRQRQQGIHPSGERINSKIQEVGQPLSDQSERQIKDQDHDCRKNRNRRILSGQNAVHLLASDMLLTLMRTNNRRITHFMDKGKTHICQSRLSIHTALRLHLRDDMLNHLTLILIQMKCLFHKFVAFDQLACSKTRRNLVFVCMIFDQMHDGVNTAVHRTSIRSFCIAEIHTSRALAITRHMYRMLHQLIDSLVLGCGNRNNRNAKGILQQVDIDRTAVLAHLVHHVERKHHRDIQLDQLQRQVQISLYVRCIHNVDNTSRPVVQEKLTAHDLLTRIWGHRIDARKIRYQRVILIPDRTILSVYCNARKVSDMLIRSGQLVKKRRLSAVLIAGKTERQKLIFTDFLSTLLYMVDSHLTKSRMLRTG